MKELLKSYISLKIFLQRNPFYEKLRNIVRVNF
jgi:hypothetical protein